MPAPLRSWAEDATGPDGRSWSVVVSVPFAASTLDSGEAEHHVSVRAKKSLRRPNLYTERVSGEPAADALVAALRQAIADGWQPGAGQPPHKR